MEIDRGRGRERERRQSSSLIQVTDNCCLATPQTHLYIANLASISCCIIESRLLGYHQHSFKYSTTGRAVAYETEMESVRGYSSSRSRESTCRRTIVHSSCGYKFFLLEYATLNLIIRYSVQENAVKSN